jgi:hypothetical protein
LALAIKAAEAHKEQRYPELVHSTRCRLVILAGEVGGRWSETTVRFKLQY